MNHYLYGRNVVYHALQADFPKIDSIIIKERIKSTQFMFKQILILANQKKIPVEYRPMDYFNQKAEGVNHQGIIAKLKNRPTFYPSIQSVFDHYPSAKSEQGLFFLLLDGIEDVRNIGALARTALFFNVNAMIVPKDRSAKLGEAAYKSSAGALSIIPVIEVVNLSRTIEELKKLDFWIYGTSLSQGQLPSEITPAKNRVLVLGNEAKGIRPNILSHCDIVLKIPPSGWMDSLNVSVAGGIFIYLLSQNPFSKGQ